MNIVVCLKQVPKKDSILRIGADGKWIDERDLSYEMSEADSYALEEALRRAFFAPSNAPSRENQRGTPAARAGRQ